MPGGRPMLPTALHKLRGTYRPDMNPNEPDLPVRLPDRPVWVDDDPRTAALFDEITRYVERMAVSSEVDGIAISLLADQLAIYLELREMIREEGLIVDHHGSQGQVTRRAHPALVQLTTVLTQIHKFLREYGLTAASRRNVSASSDEQIDSFEDFMNQQ